MRFGFVFGCILAVLVNGPAFAAGTFRTVAVQGGTAPGIPNEGRFLVFATGPSIDAGGRAAIYAFAQGQGGQTTTGIWQEGPGGLQPVVLQGQPAPGAAPGVDIHVVYSTVATNNRGEVAAAVGYTNDSTAYVIETAEGLRALGALGSPAPGLAGVTFKLGQTNNVHINEQDETAIIAALAGEGVTSENDTAVFSEAGGAGLRLLAREGYSFAGLEVGETIGSLAQVAPPQVNSVGRTVFTADILSPNQGRGLWLDEPLTGPRLVFRTGESIMGRTFDSLAGYRMSDRGEIAFAVRDVVPGLETIDAIVVEQTDGTLWTAAIKGQPVPNGQPGHTITGINTFSYRLNELGQVAFLGTLPPAGDLGDSALWISDPDDGLTMVMQEGMAAPTPTGESQAYFSFPLNFSLNNEGAMAFATNLLEEGQIQSSRQSLWVRSAEGELERIVADGDELMVQVGDELVAREINSLRFADTTKNIPFPEYFNDRGQIAFTATFVDGGSGMFVYTPGLTGDYNQDGEVNAVDYVVWRKINETPGGYQEWSQNFGITQSGTLAEGQVPEPAAFGVFALAAIIVLNIGRRARPFLVLVKASS